MKNLLTSLQDYLSQNTDRFACRWMARRDPELWNSVVAATGFLLDNAMPKQRVWHVLNDIWEIPRCPTTGGLVKWFENRYLTYSSQSAKSSNSDFQEKCRKTYEERTGHSGHWSSAQDVREKRRQAMAAKVADPDWRPTCGVKWTPERHEHYQKLWEEKRVERETRVGIYGTWKAYQQRVVIETRKTFRKHRDKIENGHLERGHTKAHLDHIYSIYEGWNHDVPPEIISHWTNLRVIPYAANVRKRIRCDKTLEQLHEDYERATC